MWVECKIDSEEITVVEINDKRMGLAVENINDRMKRNKYELSDPIDLFKNEKLEFLF